MSVAVAVVVAVVVVVVGVSAAAPPVSPPWIRFRSSIASVFADASSTIVASAASAAGETTGVWYDVPCGSRRALTVPADTSVGAAEPSATTIPHSTCRGSTVGCE